ncbi:MAG: PadR family transcriptional regulator [Proteobacteria bacterium]|nr:PadR family transcriptional regulator [Pseudomonadota bacterium]
MALQHAIMTALLEDDMSGFELARAFDASLGFFWRATHQQIYQELKKLSQKKLLDSKSVPQVGKPRKILYAITPAGRAAMDKWVYEESRVQEAKDDLFVKLYNLSSDNVPQLISELERRREQVMQRLYLYEKIRRGHYENPETLPIRRKGIYLALDWGTQHGEQFLQWCDGALEMLTSCKDMPT